MTRLRKVKASGNTAPLRAYFQLRSGAGNGQQSSPGGGEVRSKRPRESGTTAAGEEASTGAFSGAPGRSASPRDQSTTEEPSLDSAMAERTGVAANRGSPVSRGGTLAARSPRVDQRASQQGKSGQTPAPDIRKSTYAQKSEGKKPGEEKQKKVERGEDNKKKGEHNPAEKSKKEVKGGKGIESSSSGLEEFNSSGSGLDTSNDGPPNKKTCQTKSPEQYPVDPVHMDEEFPPLPSAPSEEASNRPSNMDQRWPVEPLGANQAPLTKKDIEFVLEKFMIKMEDLVKGEIRMVRESIEVLLAKVEKVEIDLVKLDKRAQENTKQTSKLQQSLVDLAAQVEDQENRGRRNNLRIRGVPESINKDELKTLVPAILNDYLDRPPKEILEIDRAHRAPGPINHNRPRDIICCLHYYTMKERILKKSWERGPLKINGMEVIILQDLGRKTLKMRRFLKPLLEVIVEKGGTYRWGYPFHLTIRKENKTFVLRTPSQVQEVCAFLGSPPITIPNWQEILLNFNFVPS